MMTTVVVLDRFCMIIAACETEMRETQRFVIRVSTYTHDCDSRALLDSFQTARLFVEQSSIREARDAIAHLFALSLSCTDAVSCCAALSDALLHVFARNCDVLRIVMAVCEGFRA
jgi:hypothetical protein